MINTIEQFKKLVGEKVIALPTGNNARRDNTPEVFIVESCGRKYVKMYRDGLGLNYQKSYCPATGATQEAITTGYGCNAGYKFFKDQGSLDEYLIERDIRNRLSEFFRAFRAVENLSVEQVRAIAEVIWSNK